MLSSLSFLMMKDWDDIAKLTGDDSWRAKHMRLYFERLEQNEFLPEETPGHGFNGWLRTEVPDRSTVEAMELFIKGALAAQDNGSEVIHDLNSIKPQHEDGVYNITLQMSRTGRRSSPRDYLVATANADGSKKYPLDIWTD
ncbi:choline dehydrogenase [Phlyctema vagabunda]|uniref:Choline dehydrogenase n=1 Tax=Phlyctema vagabunda TaxID=108571 RepID=A0ABR4PGD1_9HELO